MTIEDEINAFLEIWDINAQLLFVKEALALLKIYDVDENDDWVEKEVGKENAQNVRLIRTVHLISRIADFQSGKLCMIKSKFKDIWKRIEKNSMLPDDTTE